MLRKHFHFDNEAEIIESGSNSTADLCLPIQGQYHSCVPPEIRNLDF